MDGEISAAWSGMGELHDAIDGMLTRADLVLNEIVAKSAALVEAAAKSNFEGSHAPGMPHVGGDKPNVVTGTLRRSIRSDPIVRYGSGDYGTKVGPRAVYGRRVELGYRGSAGYPYFAPAVRNTRDQVQAIANAAWRQFLTR